MAHHLFTPWDGGGSLPPDSRSSGNSWPRATLGSAASAIGAFSAAPLFAAIGAPAWTIAAHPPQMLNVSMAPSSARAAMWEIPPTGGWLLQSTLDREPVVDL